MRQNISGKAGSYAARHKRRSHWRRLLMALACVVVFCTTYALILPAITLENPEALDAPVCGLEEHIHSESCFEARPEAQHKQFHCCDGSGNLVGISSDLVLHTHDEQCYDPDGTLVCPLPEITAHTHDASCYHASLVSQGHHHTEECISEWVQGELICALPTEAHVHGEGCYDGSGELICQISEQAHVHTDECYERLPVYSCNQEESEDVYGEQELTCQRREVFPHTHSTDCYDGSGNLTCGHLQVVSHQHTEDCYDLVEVPAEDILTCEIPEHTHDESCYEAQANGPMKAPGNGALAADGPIKAPGEIIGDPHDFTGNITQVTIERQPKNSNSWTSVLPGQPVEEGDNLRFKLEYHLPEGTVRKDKNTIVYQLPNNFKLVKEDSGRVLNNGGEYVGDYTISPEGYITITFKDDKVGGNEHAPVEGTVTFEAKVENITHSEDDIDINFSDGVTIKVPIGKPEEAHTDLTVGKTAFNINQETGTVDYTVTVSSTKGTDSQVNLVDQLIQGKLPQGAAGIVVKDKNGNVVTTVKDAEGNDVPLVPTYTENDDNISSFSLNLPKMAAGDQYTVTYTVQTNEENMSKDGSIINTATATSKNSDDTTLTGTITIETPFKRTDISKSHQYDWGGDTIKWTVTINQSKQNIGGWTLTDEFNHKDLTALVTIKDSSGNVIAENVILPYEFPKGSKDTYTVEYTTSASSPIDEQEAINKAILTPPDDKPGDDIDTGEDKVWLPNKFDPVSKKAESIIPDEDSPADAKTATVTWTVKVDATYGEITAPWTLRDEPQQGWGPNGKREDHTIPGDQLQKVKDAIASWGLSFKFEAVDGAGSTVDLTEANPDPNGTYKTFTATFADPLPKGQTKEFTFSTKGFIEDGNSQVRFSNDVFVNNIQRWADITYNPRGPVIEKTDINGSGDNTNHDYWDKNLVEDGENGILKWLIKVTPPAGYKGGPLTLTEYMPKGVELSYLEILGDGVMGAHNITADGTYTFDGYDIEKSHVDNEDGTQVITVVIPAALAENPNLKEFRFVVRVKSEDATWVENENGIPTATFENRAVISSEDDGKLGEDTQTQTVTKDDFKDALSKQNGTIEDNIIPYTLDVNPKGLDMVEGVDYVTLYDVLDTYHEPNSSLDASLVPNSVKVYHRNSDGSKGEPLPAAQVPYTYEVKEIDEGWRTLIQHNLTIQLPDATPLIVEYEYRLIGKEGQWVNVNNNATLRGVKTGDKTDNNNVNTDIQHSSATANLQGFSLRKVDSENYSVTLPGAEFSLYQWNGSEYIPAYTIDDNGVEKDLSHYVLGESGTTNIRDLTPNTAYMLVENVAPNGYIKQSDAYYFLIRNADATQYPKNVPDDFNGVELAPGEVVYFANEKSVTQIKVAKKWLSFEGEDITATTGGSIEFELWQKATRTPPQGSSGGSTVGNSATINWTGKLYSATSYTETARNLPIGTKVTFMVGGDREDFQDDPGEQSITIDGVSYPMTKSGGGTTAYTYSYTYTVARNGVIQAEFNPTSKVYCFENGRHEWTIDLAEPSEPQPDPKDHLMGTYTISQTDNWTWSSGDLPKKGEDAEGTLYYSYYVKEVSGAPGYDVIYVNNDGINSGIITIQNWAPEHPSYVLPTTGGMGLAYFTAAGLTASIGACLGLLKKRKKH